jgi:hypothetical protein
MAVIGFPVPVSLPRAASHVAIVMGSKLCCQRRALPVKATIPARLSAQGGKPLHCRQSTAAFVVDQYSRQSERW